MSKFDNYRLCYVQGNRAYFTRKELSEQWGDDWDDRPYEYNAGEPYYENEEDIAVVRIGVVNSTVKIVYPHTSFTNSPYSVKDINARIVPWITLHIRHTERHTSICSLFAGMTLKEFERKMRGNGGTICFLLDKGKN